MGQRTRVITGCLLAAATIGAAGAEATAAPPAVVDITIDEPFPTATGTVDSGSIPGCTDPTVTTGAVDVRTSGSWTTFAGTKTFTCAEGTLDIAFSARRRHCDATNSGRWQIVGASGGLAGAKGRGSLDGTYIGTGSGSGGLCADLGILDRYTGKIKLP